jgi:hypothetical protein
MIPAANCDVTLSVAAFVRGKFRALYPAASDAWLQRVFRDIDGLFAGRHPNYAPIDLRYHNLRHTLLATVCMAELLEGHHAAAGEGPLRPRDFEMAIAAVLLHDTGYLKLKRDTAGTGAKYTYCHITRSCAFAASYLPEAGADDREIELVVSAINCTGPTSDIGRLRFNGPAGRLIGCALATADYLGQLSDPLYPDKLGELYLEFNESDDFSHVPPERRAFKSESDLIARSPGFWKNFVKPRLDQDFQGVYRFLERPLGSGRNEYLAAIEANFAIIEERMSALLSRVR